MEIKNKLEDTCFFYLLKGEIKNKNQFNKKTIQITRIKIKIKNKLEDNWNCLIE
jgi:hypothetical protein